MIEIANMALNRSAVTMQFCFFQLLGPRPVSSTLGIAVNTPTECLFFPGVTYGENMKSRTLLSLLLAFIPITYVFADTVQINLTKKPVLSEEGIHLSTKQGDYSMYAVYASKNVFKVFEQG